MDQSVTRTQYDAGTIRKFKRMSGVAALLMLLLLLRGDRAGGGVLLLLARLLVIFVAHEAKHRSLALVLELDSTTRRIPEELPGLLVLFERLETIDRRRDRLGRRVEREHEIPRAVRIGPRAHVHEAPVPGQLALHPARQRRGEGGASVSRWPVANAARPARIAVGPRVVRLGPADLRATTAVTGAVAMEAIISLRVG